MATLAILVLSKADAGDSFGKTIRFDNGVSAVTQPSLIALLGSPENWDGNVVGVSGFLRSDLHGTSLFVSSEYCEKWSGQYGVPLVLDAIEPEVSWGDIPSDRCVFAHVEGTFKYMPPVAPKPGFISHHGHPTYIDVAFLHYE